MDLTMQWWKSNGMESKSSSQATQQLSTKDKASGKPRSTREPPKLVVSEPIVKDKDFIIEAHG